MMQFVCFAVLASTLMPSLSVGLKGFNLSHFGDAKSVDFHEICKWFCAEDDYEDYSFFRSLDHAVHPRIFCELCKKKFTSTTPKTTSTSTTTTTQKTSTSETTTKPTTTSETTTTTPVTSAAPVTTTPSTTPTPQPTTETTSTTA